MTSPTTADPLPDLDLDDLDDDDRPVGRFLSRREVLALFGVGGVAMATAALRARARAGSLGRRVRLSTHFRDEPAWIAQV